MAEVGVEGSGGTCLLIRQLRRPKSVTTEGEVDSDACMVAP